MAVLWISILLPVEWLCSKLDVPADLLSNDGSSFVSLPRIPPATVKQLVKGGARIAYHQLVSAAHDQVQGIHNWLVAQKEVAMSTEMSPDIETICCLDSAEYWWSEVQTLQVGINVSSLACQQYC